MVELVEEEEGQGDMMEGGRGRGVRTEVAEAEEVVGRGGGRW